MDSNIFEELMTFENDIGSFLDFKGKKEKENSSEVKPKKKLKPSEQLLQSIKDEGFDLSQMEEILKVKGNQLIVSCAGSGKTTALIFKLLYSFKSGYATKMIETSNGPLRVPEKVWVSTFLKTGADELHYAQKKWQSRLHCVDTTSAVTFSTLHAEFKRALNAMGKSTEIIQGSKNSKLLKDVVKSYQLTNGNGRQLTSDDYNNLESALSYTRNRLDTQRYEKEIYEELNIGKTIIDAILYDWKKKREKLGVWDFEDLQEFLYSECYEKNNQDVMNFLADRYSFIFIDEFQDTSQIQYKLLQVYANKCKQVVAIGDDDQTIYSWRGSDNDIILNKFREDFSPTVSNLTINFRCPSNILNAIKPSIANNTERYEKELTSHTQGGLVRYVPSYSYPKMVDTLSDLIYEDIVKGRSVAVLCRKNSDGLLPALILDKLGKFEYSISGSGMSLDSYIGRTVLSIVKLFTERNSTSVKNALNLLAWDKYGIDNLMKVCKTNKLTIWSIDSKDLAYSCPSIADRVLKWRNWKESMGEVKALKLVLQDYRVAVFEKDTQFNQVMRSVLMAVESLLDYFDYDYVEDFQLELEEINERLNARIGNKKAMVKIATVHEFKGKEADSVYVWNDSEDVYPIKDAMDSIESLEEERRIHYIACTRAKQISTIVYLSKSPGMFINEMDLSEAQEITGTTSGVLKQMREDLEMNANMREFEKVINKRTEDNTVEESQGSIKDNSQPYENKPTVENKGISEGLTFDDMSDEEFFGGLSFPSSVESDLYQDNEFWGTE